MTPEEYEERTRKLLATADAEYAQARLLAASSVWAVTTLGAAFAVALGWGNNVAWTFAAVAVVAVGFAGEAARELLRRPRP